MSKWDEMDERARKTFLAERAMGWHVGAKGWVDAGQIPAAAWVDAYGNFQAWIKDWHPLSDITAAMGLLEAMRAKGWTYRLTGMRTPHKPYFVELVRTGKRGELIDGFDQDGDILQAAIAKCCYLALGGEE